MDKSEQLEAIKLLQESRHLLLTLTLLVDNGSEAEEQLLSPKSRDTFRRIQEFLRGIK